jgi:hypothetical protein
MWRKGVQFRLRVGRENPDRLATDDRKGLSTMDIAAVLTRVIQAQQQ